MPKMNKKQISVTLDVDIIEKVDEFAETYGISRASVINMLLRSGFDGNYLALVKELKQLKKQKKQSEISEGVFAV